MISVTVPVTAGQHLDRVLSSAVGNADIETEIVVVATSPSPRVRTIVARYDGVLVDSDECGLLAARWLAHRASHGEFELMLDETRTVLPGTFHSIQSETADMIVLGEEECGVGYWSRMASIDKSLALTSRALVLDPERQNFLLPRVFRRDLAEVAFSSIRSKVGEDRFRSIVYPDHYLIFLEAYLRSKKIAVLRGPCLRHYGDDTLRTIWRKYSRYGASSKTLRGTPYQQAATPSLLTRRYPVRAFVRLLPLWAVRSVSYAVGLAILDNSGCRLPTIRSGRRE